MRSSPLCATYQGAVGVGSTMKTEAGKVVLAFGLTSFVLTQVPPWGRHEDVHTLEQVAYVQSVPTSGTVVSGGASTPMRPQF